MSLQVEQDARLSQRLSTSFDNVIVLERFARGGGGTRWFFARSRSELREVIERLRGGSCVSFYFGQQLNVEIDGEEVRQKMFDLTSPSREILVGYPASDETSFKVELVTGPSELGELLLGRREGTPVVWGTWPESAPDDGSTITIYLVDEDGVQRRHPY